MNSASKLKTLALFVICVLAIPAPAQTFTTLLSFNDATGGNPGPGSLVQGIDGNLYGSAFDGGPKGDGTVFKITPAGTLSMLHFFHGTADGSNPTGVVLGSNGNLYGTTQYGGSQSPTCNLSVGCGTIFGFTAAGTLFTLHTFDGLDGISPRGLMLGSDGNFYGTTQASASGCQCGTIFKISPASGFKFTLLHAFSNTDGADPEGPLVQGANGNFYGTTTSGGLYGYGTVFEITPQGTFTTLHNFGSADGSTPFGALVQAADGNLYGTTELGGVPGNGTVFFISPGGHTFQKLYEFTGGSDGSNPTAGLVLRADGNFYGATNVSTTACACGTIFEITTNGVLTTLHTFDGTDGGHWPTLIQDTSGTFYGTTLSFGANNNCPENGCGTAFSLSTGLGPFVTTVPPSRGIGARVIILGQGLTGSTSVTFNGVAAQFTVNSDTEITTFVPIGAKTGYVQVTTPAGNLSTKVVFVVG